MASLLSHSRGTRTITGGVIVSKRIPYILMTVAIMWLLFAVFAPFFLNGNLYHIQSPAEVRIINDKVHVRIIRTSKINAIGDSSIEAVCDEVHYLPTIQRPIEKGTSDFWSERNLPPHATGECYFSAVMTYTPFGRIGPTLSHSWYSEKFIAP